MRIVLERHVDDAAVGGIHRLKGVAFAAAGHLLRYPRCYLAQRLEMAVTVATHIYLHPQVFAFGQVLGNHRVSQNVERFYHMALAANQTAHVIAQDFALKVVPVAPYPNGQMRAAESLSYAPQKLF